MPSKDKPTYEIYQLKNNDENYDLRFIGIDSLMKKGQKPDIQRYDLVYSGDFSEFKSEGDSVGEQLEAIYRKFNIERPDDFKGHSLSVSDVVVVKDKSYYVDTFGFKELKAFKGAAEREQKKAEEQEKKAAPKKPKR